MSRSADLSTLQQAFKTYVDKETKRINAQADFLTAIAAKRGGTVGLQDANAQGASQILSNSISEYLGQPVDPQNSQ